MFRSSVFDRTYKDYITQVFNVDLESRAEKLGVRIDGDELLISFFGKPYRVSPKGIADPSGKRPAHSISVVLCKVPFVVSRISSEGARLGVL